MTQDDANSGDSTAGTHSAGHVVRDARTGKFKPPAYRNPDALLAVAQQRVAELWLTTDSLDARARHIGTLVATTCLLPFLVASNFPATGAFRLIQGLLLAVTSGCSLTLVWRGLAALKPMSWKGMSSTDELLRYGSQAQSAPDVATGLLKSMVELDRARAATIEDQADGIDDLQRHGCVALLAQAAAAASILALGLFARA